MNGRRLIGVPYGPSVIDDLGKYGVQCPVCPQTFMEPPGATTEDEITKGAAALYADHYEKAHHEEEE